MQTDSLHTEELLVNMGPQHPSTHGVLRLVVKTDGESVQETLPLIGFLHRSFEKIAETLTYKQVVPYTDRLDYLSSMNNSLAYCLAIEKLANLEVPERASILRVITAELNRIASHLLAFGSYALDLGAYTPFLYSFRERELILSIFEKISGGRLLYHYNRIGGVARDINIDIISEIGQFIDIMRKKLNEYNELVTENLIFIKRTANIGLISMSDAINYGVTGPCLRASGLKYDLRKVHPYSLYEKFNFDVPIGQGLKGQIGDCFDRYWVRLKEIEESLKIVEQALDLLREGEIRTKISANLKLPAGEVYVPCENPRGELGFYIISDGKPNALRVKVRAPSFCNLSILDPTCRNTLFADVVSIVGSIDIVLGEVDR
ncbi:MAG: NADH-quinone oxidoreductase subunit D [Deltaproteobacteria bacterium]|jgi:NADH-quinone oxidoreductase subunit D|nr:NADH-quinone oxidoreductase subunit D [Deltaproteobacteria bacterium]